MIDEQTELSNSSDSPRRPRLNTFWKELPILLGVAILVAILVRAFLLQTFFIPSPSMEHTLNINDRVLVNKLVYDFRAPHRGEVIVFTSPLAWRSAPGETDFIKRVIGVGGDHVACCDTKGRMTVNGVPLTETYLNADSGDLPASPNQFSVVVPKGRLWVMGDNRYFSGDSRERYQVTGNATQSTIATSAVIGRAFVVFWPLGRAKRLTVPSTFAHVPNATTG